MYQNTHTHTHIGEEKSGVLNIIMLVFMLTVYFAFIKYLYFSIFYYTSSLVASGISYTHQGRVRGHCGRWEIITACLP